MNHGQASRAGAEASDVQIADIGGADKNQVGLIIALGSFRRPLHS